MCGCFYADCSILLNTIGFASRIQNIHLLLFLYRRKVTVHTQYVFKKTKQKTIHVAFQNKEKYFTFLLLLKLLKRVDQEGCDSCRWGGGREVLSNWSVARFICHYFSNLILSTVELRSLDVFPVVCHLSAFATVRWGIVYSAKKF